MEAIWSETLVQLFTLAARLEEAGQYNLAKLSRAQADAMVRREAFRRAPDSTIATGKDELAAALEQVTSALEGLGADARFLATFRSGAAAMQAGRLPMIVETPIPYVCRICGHLQFGDSLENCPTCQARPATFQRFPPMYWLDALDPFQAPIFLRQTPEQTAAILTGLPEEFMSLPAPDGGWGIRNIISHMRDAQGVLSYRVGLLLEQNNPLLASQAVFEWAAEESGRPASTHEIFAAYRAARDELTERLERLPLAEWYRKGRHEEFGVLTLCQQVSYFATHELTHLPQLERMRAEWQG